MQGGKEKFLLKRKDPHLLGMVEGPVHREGMARMLLLLQMEVQISLFWAEL